MSGDDDVPEQTGDIPVVLSFLLDQTRVNFRLLRMLAALSEGESISSNDVTELSEIVVKQIELIPDLAKTLMGYHDEP